jgi:hypothetical protein
MGYRGTSPTPTPTPHGQIYYIELDTKAKCRHLKNCAGTLRPVFDRIYRLVIQSCWYFRPSFANCCPSNLLSGLVLPPFPIPCVKSIQYTRTQCEGAGGRGVLVSYKRRRPQTAKHLPLFPGKFS